MSAIKCAFVLPHFRRFTFSNDTESVATFESNFTHASNQNWALEEEACETTYTGLFSVRTMRLVYCQHVHWHVSSTYASENTCLMQSVERHCASTKHRRDTAALQAHHWACPVSNRQMTRSASTQYAYHRAFIVVIHVRCLYESRLLVCVCESPFSRRGTGNKLFTNNSLSHPWFCPKITIHVL